MKCIATIIVLVVAVSSVAVAGSLQVSPVRVDFAEKRTTAVVQVTNTADEPITIQVDVRAWRAPEGKDSLDETNDVIVNPPVFTIASGKRQTIRLGLRSFQRSAVEQTYRLILDEVPKRKPGVVATALRISIPMFVAPQNASAAKLRWSATFSPEGNLILAVQNGGAVHAKVVNLAIDAGGSHIEKQVLSYVLAGSKREYVISDERLKHQSTIGLDITTETGTAHEELTPTMQ